MRVVPTAVALKTFRQPLSGVRKEFKWDDPRKKLLCLTRYYPHKNLEVFIELAQLIKNNKKPYTIITTISEDQHPGASRLLELMQLNGVEEVIQNIGPVPMDEVPALYEVTDGLLLPTLLESFSGTYVDAMHMKRPIFTSDRDFAHDVCGKAAFYFDPLAPGDILETLDSGFEHADHLHAMCRTGYERVLSFPDWNEVASMYLDLLELTASTDFTTAATLL